MGIATQQPEFEMEPMEPILSPSRLKIQDECWSRQKEHLTLFWVPGVLESEPMPKAEQQWPTPHYHLFSVFHINLRYNTSLTQNHSTSAKIDRFRIMPENQKPICMKCFAGCSWTFITISADCLPRMRPCSGVGKKRPRRSRGSCR